jgi:hypothetical protein
MFIFYRTSGEKLATKGDDARADKVPSKLGDTPIWHPNMTTGIKAINEDGDGEDKPRCHKIMNVSVATKQVVVTYIAGNLR